VGIPLEFLSLDPVVGACHEPSIFMTEVYTYVTVMKLTSETQHLQQM